MTISRRDIAIILPIAILPVALAQVAHAEAIQQAPSNWDFGPRVQWFLGAAVIPIAGAGVLLFFAAKHPLDSFIFRMRPAFFFWLGMTYTMLLVFVAIAYNLSYRGPQPYLVGNMLPVAVPWFGALGAVAISLEGVFKWSESRWNPELNYWHVGRPLFGAVLGTIGFFLFVLILSSSGTTPKFLENPTDPTPAKDFIIYYVVAFLAGYREETFRELIQRVTDMILKPAQPATALPQVSFKRDGVAQSEIKFAEAAGNIHEPVSIEISNSSRAPLLAPRLALIATDPASKDVFGLAKDLVTGAPELGPNQAGTVSITFAPRAAGTYSGVLSVSASNLTAPATIRVVGSATAPPVQAPPVVP